MFVAIVTLDVQSGRAEEVKAFGPFPSIIAAQIFERDELNRFVGSDESVQDVNIVTCFDPDFRPEMAMSTADMLTEALWRR